MSTKRRGKELQLYRADDYEEIIFSGYGEPTMRLDELLEVAQYLKANTKAKVRINTNGLADPIHEKRTTPMLVASYEAILTYIRDVKNYVERTAVSVVSCIPAAAIEKCRGIAEDLGVDFKIR